MNVVHRRSAAACGIIAVVAAVSAGVGLGRVLGPDPGLAAPATRAARVPSVITAPTEDRFVPIQPCRIADVKLRAGVKRALFVSGSMRFGPQGGRQGGCGVPRYATAIAASLTAAKPTTSGYVRAWAAGKPEPALAQLRYGRSTATASATIAIKSASNRGLRVHNVGGRTTLAVDVSGYYVAPMSALIQSDGVTYDGTMRVRDSGRLGVGQYWVEFDRDITYCQVNATTYNTSSYMRVDTFSDPSTKRIRVIAYNNTGAVTDSWFYVVVTC